MLCREPAAPGAATPLSPPPHQPASGMRGLPRFPSPAPPRWASREHSGEWGTPDPVPRPCTPDVRAQPPPLTRAQATLPRRPVSAETLCGPSPQTPRLDAFPDTRRPNFSARPSPSLPLCAPLARRPRGHSGRAGRTRPAYLGRAPRATSVPRCQAEPAGLGGAFIAATSSLCGRGQPRPASPFPCPCPLPPGVRVTHPHPPARQ